MTKEINHLVASGDHLFGCSHWACGPAGPNERGYFGSDGTWHLINCDKCIKSDLYRELAAEDGWEHPYTTRAKKAWETIRRKKAALEKLEPKARRTTTRLV